MRPKAGCRCRCPAGLRAGHSQTRPAPPSRPPPPYISGGAATDGTSGRSAQHSGLSDMIKLVVLSALVALASAKPGFLHGAVAPAAISYAAPAVAAAPAISYAAPAVAAAPAIAYAAPAAIAAPISATVVSKQVHYASTPVVTGYSAQVLKPNLGALATPAETVSKEQVIAPARSVATITPQITQVEPEVSVQSVPVDVPVPKPVVSEVEVRTPAVAAIAAPVAVATHAAPAIAAYAAAPAVVAGHAVTAYGIGGVHYKTLAAPIVKIH
ncbi:cuticle protein 16.5-like [Schistocerca americana]|uniref:cuticle protein 16.5-like n=1 Tax=Schistocerca americana TaxID=7009 RepID=UPI001F4FC4EB|nr:cuticle protein 16.5-like [Schistocerca americana]